MRRDRRLMRQSFGINEWGLADLPVKVSNVRLAWIFHSFLGRLLPGQPESSRDANKKSPRSWRFYRHRPYKITVAASAE